MELNRYESLGKTARPLTLKDPQGDELTFEPEPGTSRPVTITLYSCDSHEYLRISKEQVTAMGERVRTRGRAVVTGDSAERDRVDLLVACTVSWEGLTKSGAPFPCTPSNARELYTRYQFIREQVDAFVHDRGNFLTSN